MTSRKRRTRGRKTALHKAAAGGSIERTIALLSMGSIDIDQGDPAGWTPLMYAAHGRHSRVAQILLSRGADVSIAADDDVVALHLCTENGHLAMTIDLVKAGAEVDVKTSCGLTPLHYASQKGCCSEVVAVLIEAGASVDSRDREGWTPLNLAASGGHLDDLKQLLRANANPLLAGIDSEGCELVPLDSAARFGHLEVVRELIRQVGIEGCGGDSGGLSALENAAENGHVDIMAMLADAGVVDTGKVLVNAARQSWEAEVKFLLQRRQLEGSPTDLVGYVHSLDEYDATPLFNTIDGFDNSSDSPHHLISARVVRLLIDAGADTSAAVRVMNEAGSEDVYFDGTPLAFTIDCLANKRVGGEKGATEEQMFRLEAVRRLLLRVEAVHAVSWLWHKEPIMVGCAAGGPNVTARETSASGAQMASMLPILRRRRGTVILGPLFRWGQMCA